MKAKKKQQKAKAKKPSQRKPRKVPVTAPQDYVPIAKKFTATQQAKGLNRFYTIRVGESTVEICVPRITVIGRTEIVVDNERVL